MARPRSVYDTPVEVIIQPLPDAAFSKVHIEMSLECPGQSHQDSRAKFA